MKVEVRKIDNAKGRGLFATSKIEKGSVIFEENPIVSCQLSWNAECRYRVCDHCLRPLETAEENARRLTGCNTLELPYPECCTTDKHSVTSCNECGQEYCSNECRALAYEQYHKTLCTHSRERNGDHPLEQLNEAWKNVHYPPETNSIMLIVRLLARIMQAPNREAAVAEMLQFCHRSVNDEAQLAHKFLGEKFVHQLDLLHNLLLQAMPQDELKSFTSSEGFHALLALIGTNGQGIGTSPVSQWVKNVEELPLPSDKKIALDAFINKLYSDMETHTGSFLNNEGVGLYTLQSSCNHSCDPNAEPSFFHNNHRLSLVALRDIEEGEEIFISYLDECSLERSRHSRRKELMENYLFLCDCVKCQEQADEPDVTSEEDEDEEDDGSDD